MFYSHWSLCKRALVCLSVYAALCLLLFAEALVKSGLAALLLPLFAVNTLYLFTAVLAPLRALNAEFKRFNRGYDAKSIFTTPLHFTRAERHARCALGHRLDNPEVSRLSNRQAQYLALQNQINPHFLYNTLEAIRGDALSLGMRDIASITEALATFFRYTISNMDNLVLLEEELANAENYFAIQNYRFGERISMRVDYEAGSEMASAFQLPKLTLQPIIENAIIHGLENQVGAGCVHVRIATDGARLLIEVADDGVGMSEDVLDEINRRLASPEALTSHEERARSGRIALVNVNNRIKLLFGEPYGLRVSSIVGLGTRVDIQLPVRRASQAGETGESGQSGETRPGGAHAA